MNQSRSSLYSPVASRIVEQFGPELQEFRRALLNYRSMLIFKKSGARGFVQNDYLLCKVG